MFARPAKIMKAIILRWSIFSILAHLFHADVLDDFAGKFAWVLGG